MATETSSAGALFVSRACLQAYVDKDRAAIDRLVAEDFRFTSPLDNALDRAGFFNLCWPNTNFMNSASAVHSAETGDRVFIVYEATTGQKRFRNCEMHVVRDGRLVEVEVYFGWDLPHPAEPGQHVLRK